MTGAQKCVVRAADQLASRLAGAGFRASVLTEQELTSALATSSCASPMAIAQAGRGQAQGAAPRRPRGPGGWTTGGTRRTGWGAGPSWAAGAAARARRCRSWWPC
ncbi:type VII secretion protein EccE [Streptomyces diastatochromogenes]|nr:type VII secretion protein EccE [Streptomyces diastatochromogenes]